jgi:ABC-2 type transport system permease protein
MPTPLVRTEPGEARPGSATAMLSTELLKLRTVPACAVLVTAGALLTAFLALQQVAGAGKQGAPSIGTAALLLALLSAAARGQLLALVIGVLAVTTERRHGTLTATLLQTPHRVRLLCAKAAAAVLVGLLLGLIDLAVAAVVAISSEALRGPLINGEVVLAAAGQLLGYPLWALLGVGIGALLMASQPIAVLLPVAWLLLLESYAEALARDLSPWLPGRLTSALANTGDLANLLPVWVGGLGLVGYGLFLLGLGATRLALSDVG